MRIAEDKTGNIIFLSNVRNNKELFCRCCHKPVYYVAGDLSCKYGKSSHFRHFPGCRCSDDWNHDKTIWHKNWQDCFPIENQEIILKTGDEKHIADVLIPESAVVVEFQHSHITPDEFNARNRFYVALGFRVIWVFDVQKQFARKKIGISECGYFALRKAYYWTTPIDCLRTYVLDDNVAIFLQIKGYEKEVELVRVSKSDDGFGLFYAPRVYSKEKFLAFVHSPDNFRKYRFHHSKEEFDRYGDRRYKCMDCNGIKTVMGCPRVSSGSVVSIEKCRKCPYYVKETAGKVGCLKHYLSLSIYEEIHAGAVYRDKLNQIKWIELSAIPNETLFSINVPMGKSIDEIWKEYKSAGIIIFLNLYSGSEVKMCRSWYQADRDRNNYECEIKMPGHHDFMKDRRQVIFPDKKQFAVLWWKTPSKPQNYQ